MEKIWNIHKQSNTPLKRRVFVGLSGGVDSSVSAYLLQREGYEVVGVHLRCWNRDGCDEKEARDARLVANKLGIPFYVLDMEKEYKERVVDYMVQSYGQGLTPNPDVMCNKEIKFGLFFDKAMAMGADFVATGHYAKISKLRGDRVVARAKDEDKDQSYFLWTLGADQLEKIIFPLGNLLKSEVRNIAKKAKLHVADKKDSQGICFVGKVTLQDFLREHLEDRRGDVLDIKGKVVGTHQGAHLYTIGQRHGLGVALNEPHYVAHKDVKTNTVVLAPEKDETLGRKEVNLGGVLVHTNNIKERVLARVRYRQPLEEALLEKTTEGYKLSFEKPVRFVAPGQSAVFYDNKGRLLGGGIIL
ncbi:MAG: tRNA 2-thiouridine(34) synthase MnmA [Candidatus Colwellbacteria bacterium]